MKASPFRPEIAKLHLEGVSCSEISKRLGAPKSTVCKVVAQLKARGNVDELPKCGRPKSVDTNAIGIEMKKILDETSDVSMNKMALCLGVSRSTVQRIAKTDKTFKKYLNERLDTRKKKTKS